MQDSMRAYINRRGEVIVAAYEDGFVGMRTPTGYKCFPVGKRIW